MHVRNTLLLALGVVLSRHLASMQAGRQQCRAPVSPFGAGEVGRREELGRGRGGAGHWGGGTDTGFPHWILSLRLTQAAQHGDAQFTTSKMAGSEWVVGLSLGKGTNEQDAAVAILIALLLQELGSSELGYNSGDGIGQFHC